MTPTPAPLSRLLASCGELTLRVRGSGHDGRLIRIRSPKCTIGSAAGCTLRLRAPGVRPLQCWILRGAAGAVIRRLHGAATLNGAALDESPLVNGDRLRLGSVELEVVECCSPAAAAGPSPFPRPTAAALETVELETRLTTATERIARLEAESRQGFQSSIVAADRADQMRDALAAAHQQLAEACRELAAAQETMTRQTAELDGYRRQLNEVEAEEGELAEELVKARRAADAAAGERAARETEAAEAQARLTTQTERWECERLQLERRLEQREAELEAIRCTSTAQTGQMTIAMEAIEVDPALQEAEARCGDLQRQLDEQRGEVETLRRLVGEQAIVEGRLEALSRELDEKCAELKAAEARSVKAVEQSRRQDELDARAQSLAQQEADLVERVARVTETKQQLAREREALVAERDAAQAAVHSAGERETQLEQQAAELEKHIEAANTRLVEVDELRNQLTGERAALDERAHRLGQRQRELETKETDLQQQWTQIEVRRDEVEQQAVEVEAGRQAAEQRIAALAQRQQELERLASELAPREQLAHERERQIEEQLAALAVREQQLEALAADLASQRHNEDQSMVMTCPLGPGPEGSSPVVLESAAGSPNVTVSWDTTQTPDASMNAALDCDGEASPSTMEGVPDAVAAPPGGDNVSDSKDVDLLLSRLVRAGLWRDGGQPEAEPAVATHVPAAGPASQDAAPVAAVELPAPALAIAPPPVPAKNSAEHGDDESIESYMDRLLKRVRGDSPAAVAKAPSPPPVEAAPVPVVAPVVATAPAEEKVEDSAEFLPRTTAPELPANLSAMRELANTAARTAIDRHVRKHTGRQAAGRLVGAGLTIATSVLLGYWAWQGHSVQAGAGAAIGGSVGIYWTLAALRRLFGTMRLNRPQEAESPTVPGE